LFTHSEISNGSLPMGTLALTFDDGPGAAIGEGPGPRTGQIAQFLHGLGVRATFFCLGRHVAEWPGVLAQIKSFGHLIANHGYDHAHLAELEAVGGDVVSQVARGEAAIRPWLDAPKALFRAPYFGWSAAVANALNADLRTHLAHVGPLGGDIDGDWMYWGSGGDPADVAQHYLETIRARGRGIVVLHDSSADSAVARAGNGALEAVRLLVPQLLAEGFTFVRGDEIPEVSAQMHLPTKALLTSAGGRTIRLDGRGTSDRPPAPSETDAAAVLFHLLPGGKVALQGAHGGFLARTPSAADGLGFTAATKDSARLDLISVGPNRIGLRTEDGDYLFAKEAGSGALKLGGDSLEREAVFSFHLL